MGLYSRHMVCVLCTLILAIMEGVILFLLRAIFRNQHFIKNFNILINPLSKKLALANFMIL